MGIISIFVFKPNVVIARDGEHIFEPMINDGNLEYDYGLNFVMSNSINDPHISGSKPLTNPPYPDDSQTITISNRRDRSTGLENDDRRGWNYYGCEWLTNSEIYRFHDNNEGHNEYLDDSYNPTQPEYGNVIEGIQEGSYYDGYWNTYRRAVMMLYSRQLPSPVHYSTVVSFPNSFPNGLHTYLNGSDLWIPANVNTDITDTGIDVYPDSYGQNAQYEGTIRNNEIIIKSTNNNSISIDKYMDADGNYSNDVGTQKGDDLVQDFNVSGGINENGNSPSRANVSTKNWNGMEREFTSATMTINGQDGLNLEIGTKEMNKYNRWDGYSGGFTYNNVNYSELKIDGIAPGFTDTENTNVDSNVQTSVNMDSNLNISANVVNLYDNESGIKSVYAKIYPCDEDGTQQDGIEAKTVQLNNVNGNWTLDNTDAYGLFPYDPNKTEYINVDIYTEDNVGNVGKIYSKTLDLFTVHAYVVPYQNPSYNPDTQGLYSFESGQYAILKIFTSGYPDKLEITYPDELSEIDDSLDKDGENAMSITPQKNLETDVVFKIPEYTPIADNYIIDVIAHRTSTGSEREDDRPKFNVVDNIFNGIRTRINNNNSK